MDRRKWYWTGYYASFVKEGPFWGNGKKWGSAVCARTGKLCISVDHVGPLGAEGTLSDEPKAVFPEILKHKGVT